jgi:ABC-2 type transport system ATP-binding protein
VTETQAITARDLTKTYGSVQALAGVSLSVEPALVFALLGPNGAGKSTTVKILTTLSRADSGEARVAGLDVVRDAAAVRRAIGVVGQKPGFDGDATGRENLEMQAAIHGARGSARRRRTSELLRQFGLADAADRLAKTYSGGMQRRLDVALGLAHRPHVLFLDEPTTGLDPEARAQMWSEIERVTREDGVTVLLTTHYLEEADRLAAEVAIIDRGLVVASGSPEQLKSELRGDTVQIQFAQEPDAQVTLLAAEVAGVAEVALDGRVFRARAADGAAALPALIAALTRHGPSVASATISRPSLDEVYLRHAGRSFEQAEREQEVTA